MNDQVTDAVTQAAAQNLGAAPSVATGNFYVATGQALAQSATHSAELGHQNDVTANAATTVMVMRILQ